MEKNQKHTENGIDKQDTISPVFWESFDKVESEAELEKTQINKNSTTNKKAEQEEEKKVNTLILSEEIEDDIDIEDDIFDEVEDDTVVTDRKSQNDTENTDTAPLCLVNDENKKEDTNKTEENDQNTETTLIVEEDNKTVEEGMEETKISTPPSLEVTQRLDTIEDKSAFLEMLQNMDTIIEEDELGDKNAYLDTVESENFEEEPEESLEDDIYYDEETSSALYRAERKRLKIILISSLAVGVIVFLIGYIIMGMHQRELKEELEKQLAAQQTVTIDNRLVMVRTIATNRELSVHDINSNEQYIIKTNNDTKFFDRFRRQSSVTKIQRGDLVSIIMSDDGQTAKEIYYSADTWMAKEVNGLFVNPPEKTVSITFVDGTEQKTYHYTDDKLFLYKDGEIAPQSIAPCDVITMQGRGDTVWSIKIIESHGTMTLKHEDEIENGVLTVDNQDRFALEGFGSLAVTEGVHKISVTGDNIEPFEDTIFVVPREDFVYDLSNAQSKTGVVIIKANVYDFKLYINGADADGKKPIVLPLGDYEITVQKNGYKTWSQMVTVVEPSITVDVLMEEDIQEGVVSFHSTPAGATIIWNGNEIGVTPLEHTVRYGVYKLEVVLEGYKPYLETVVVDKSAVTIAPHFVVEENTVENQLQ